MKRTVALRLVQVLSLLSGLPLSEAGFRKGFKKEVPALEDIPTIASQVRRYLQDAEPNLNDASIDEPDYSLSNASGPKKSSKKGKAGKGGKAAGKAGKAGKSGKRSEIEQGNPEFDGGELSFVILMDEYARGSQDEDLGSNFAFSGRLATDDYLVGRSSGTCVVDSEINTALALCTFYLKFNAEGDYGYGTVSMTGTTDEIGGYMQVTGTGADLSSSNEGSASLVFDPAGNPVIYLMITLR